MGRKQISISKQWGGVPQKVRELIACKEKEQEHPLWAATPYKDRGQVSRLFNNENMFCLEEVGRDFWKCLPHQARPSASQLDPMLPTPHPLGV